MRMHHRLPGLLILTAAATASFAQNPTPRLAFEVASVKKSPTATGGFMRVRFGSREGDRWLAENATLRILLRNAYDTHRNEHQTNRDYRAR
jgi:hypothetical protein